MARKQYGVAVEVEDSKWSRKLGVRGSWMEVEVELQMGAGALLAVAESRCLHIFIHSLQRQRQCLPTTAKLWNA